MNKIKIIEIDIILYKIKFNNKIKSKCIMEIVKQNETFILSDATDLFLMHGSVTYDNNRTVNIQLDILNSNGETIGNGYYHKYFEDSNISFGVTCSEDLRMSLIEYMNSIIPKLLTFDEKSN